MFTVLWGKLEPILENVAHLSVLSLYKDMNTMDVVLGEEDEVKLEHLTSIMASSKMSGKFTYASWPRYLYEGEGSQSGVVVEALL